MSDINFLENQRRGEAEKPKDNKKEELAWSDPEKSAERPKNSAFSFLPFANKKKSAKKKPVSVIDKNRIKKSRQEILNLIKHHENSKPSPQAQDKSFLTALAGKLKKSSAPKEALIDYQRIFDREKEHKEQIGKVFNIKPILEKKSAAAEKFSLTPPLKAERAGLNWFGWLKRLFKGQPSVQNFGPSRTAETIKPFKVEKVKSQPLQPEAKIKEKPAEAKETKIKETEPIKREARRRVLETNLMQGELSAAFDWRSKIIILIVSILAPLAVVGAAYYGLTLYQKSSQAKNSARAQKFAELAQAISQEEIGLKEILAFQFKLKAVSRIFAQHIYWTNFFKFLEDNTIKDVYFVNFKGDTGGNYTMNAMATAYGSIAEQVKVFKDNKKITAVSANGGELTAGDDKNKTLVKFILNFSVLKSIFTE